MNTDALSLTLPKRKGRTRVRKPKPRPPTFLEVCILYNLALNAVFGAIDLVTASWVTGVFHLLYLGYWWKVWQIRSDMTRVISSFRWLAGLLVLNVVILFIPV